MLLMKSVVTSHASCAQDTTIDVCQNVCSDEDERTCVGPLARGAQRCPAARRSEIQRQCGGSEQLDPLRQSGDRTFAGERRGRGRTVLDFVKKIGFLSFGHWTPSPYSEVRSE